MRNVGHYSIESEIGEGGMGTVYRAIDPRFGRMVAIKILHPQFRRDPIFIDRFKKEAVLQAKLSHPNIVSVIDFIADESTLAMVLEYIKGPSLADLLREAGGPIQEVRAIRLMIQVLAALQFAHEHQVVHRDVKPANVLVVRFGTEEVAKVLDFGIAKIAGDEKTRTQVGAKMGTLGYMAPEQIRSPRDTDRRADVYSAGVVLHELLTGRVPFDAETEYEVMQRIVHETPNLVGLPIRIARILERALDKDPGRRFQTAGLMRDALVALSNGRVEEQAPLRPPIILDVPRRTSGVEGAAIVTAVKALGVPGAVGLAMIMLAAVAGGALLVKEGIDRWRLGFGGRGETSVKVGASTPTVSAAATSSSVDRAEVSPAPSESLLATPAIATRGTDPNAAPATRTAATGRLLASSLPWPLVSASVAGRVVPVGGLNLAAGSYNVVLNADRQMPLFNPLVLKLALAAGQSIDLGRRVPTGRFRFELPSVSHKLFLGTRELTRGSGHSLPVGQYSVKIETGRAGRPNYSGEVDIRVDSETFITYKWGSIAGWTMK